MSNRWQGDASEFSWERDALAHIKSILPDRAPYAARQCFQFTGTHGRVWECDLLVAAPSGLYLIEIKSHRGQARNRGSKWIFDSDGAINNPLHITDQKCKELRSQLDKAAGKRNWGPVPFITPIVFLSATDLVCKFDEIQRVKVYGRERLGGQTKLPEIGSDLLLKPPGNQRNRVTPAFANHLPQLLTDIGVTKLRSGVQVGTYVLEPKAFDAGPTWSDYRAEHTQIPGDLRRVRVYYAEQDDTAERRRATRAVAQREYRATLGIGHDGIVRVDSYFDDTLDAGPAVVFRHGKDWQRLPEYMAQYGDDLVIDHRIDMIRQLVDALDHAHRNRLYHRALGAQSVFVVPPNDDEPLPRLRIADWQTAGGQGGTGELPGLTSRNMTTLARHLHDQANVYLAPEVDSGNAEPAQLDVFGLGSIAYLILTGRPPAANRGELINQLSQDRALVPSAVRDDLLPSVDELIRDATAVAPADRLMDVKAFSVYLDYVENELTDPDPIDMPDPLTAVRGDVLGLYKVQRVLGKGASARALLATDGQHDNRSVVLKVGLEGTPKERLEQEAAQLQHCRSSYIVERFDGPIRLGARHALVLQPAGDRTLADVLSREGLTLGELQGWSEDLFAILDFLEQKGIRHRDIKPANLGIQGGNKRRDQLVIFDFSLADVSEDNYEAGTKNYRDPFLGPPNRQRFDDAAERYSAAVTLHEMASRQLPIWGDGVTPPSFTQAETPVLAEESFHPAIRDGLVKFFRTALHRDHTKRYSDVPTMFREFRRAFDALDTQPPVTTSDTVAEQSTSVQDARERARDAAQPETSLTAAGLSDRALALAHDRLGVSTAGELARINPDQINRLRGEGMRIRNELSRIASAWRQRFSLAEASPETDAVPATEWETAKVDRLAGHFVPSRGDAQQLKLQRLLLALPDDDTPSPTKPWSTTEQIAAHAGVAVAEVITALRSGRTRWYKSKAGTRALRETVLDLLEAHGRVMSADALARALLGARGSDLTDPGERLNRAHACLRVAYESDQERTEPQLTYQRYPNGTVVFASVSADRNQPVESDLIEYAEQLATKAANLVELGDSEPLPSAGRVRSELGAMEAPHGMVPLSDTDMVRLAGDLTPNAGVTPRLELYPVDLDLIRVVRLTNLALLLDTDEGIEVTKLSDRVNARFPELQGFPKKPSELVELLKRCGLNVVLDGGKIRLKRVGTLSSRRSGSRTSGRTVTPVAQLEARLIDSGNRGGFQAIRVNTKHTLRVTQRLFGIAGITPVDVSAGFVDELKSVWHEGGEKPSWQAVLAADSPDAPLKAQRGFTRLLAGVWPRMAKRLADHPGTVLLHNAAPLARYEGGQEVLASLIQAARQSGRIPHGLWLVCPMEMPHQPARLDDHLVGAIESQGEQLTLPGDFVAGA